jgi:Endonuclease/Exonuclease/phosphatase family
MRVATWNVNSLRVRLPQVLQWLGRCPVDVLALQQMKLTDSDFPHHEFAAHGYHSIGSGQKTHNGVALWSRSPCTAVMTRIPECDDAPRRLLAATLNGLRVVNLYVPNSPSGGAEKYAYKLRWLQALDAWLRIEARAHASHRPRRFQYCPRRGRRARSCEMDGPGARERARVGRITRPRQHRARGCVSVLRSAPSERQLVGLSWLVFPPQ